MLGFYVHTHWGYHNPYAARSWTLENWWDYLSGLSGLGYDTVMVWPLLDSMPLRFTPSDRAFLERIGRVIELAHRQFGMRTIICGNSNVMGNEEAEKYRFEERPYFRCEAKLNPASPDGMRLLEEHWRRAFDYLYHTDMFSIIDSDPGGFIGSTNAEFVELVRTKVVALRELNPDVELYYWMHVGWENYNRFWEEARNWQDPNSPPPIRWDLDVFAGTLRLMQERVPEPWGLFVNHPNHFAAAEQLGLTAKCVHLPYGVVEGEPTFPLTNWDPALLDQALNHPFPGFWPASAPRGRMGNAQTHCLQLPHTYLFAHLAQGGSLESADLERFAGSLLPDCASLVAQGWSLLETGDPDRQQSLADQVERQAAQEQRTGSLRGLLFGDPARFLTDLALNLRVRARLTELGSAIASRSGIKPAVQAFLRDFRPYQQRLGFQDAYGGPLYTALNEPLKALGDPGLDRALGDFTNWADPSVRNGALVRLLDALEAFALGSA
jgi:hypothetical protein